MPDFITVEEFINIARILFFAIIILNIGMLTFVSIKLILREDDESDIYRVDGNGTMILINEIGAGLNKEYPI
jgi:hypothetical protein